MKTRWQQQSREVTEHKMSAVKWVGGKELPSLQAGLWNNDTAEIVLFVLSHIFWGTCFERSSTTYMRLPHLSFLVNCTIIWNEVSMTAALHVTPRTLQLLRVCENHSCISCVSVASYCIGGCSKWRRCGSSQAERGRDHSCLRCTSAAVVFPPWTQQAELEHMGQPVNHSEHIMNQIGCFLMHEPPPNTHTIKTLHHQ